MWISENLMWIFKILVFRENKANILKMFFKRYHFIRSQSLEIVDRAYILYEGAVLMEGVPSAIVGDSEVRRVYLGDRFQL